MQEDSGGVLADTDMTRQQQPADREDTMSEGTRTTVTYESDRDDEGHAPMPIGNVT